MQNLPHTDLHVDLKSYKELNPHEQVNGASSRIKVNLRVVLRHSNPEDSAGYLALARIYTFEHTGEEYEEVDDDEELIHQVVELKKVKNLGFDIDDEEGERLAREYALGVIDAVSRL